MEKPIASLPLCYDIANFDELDGYVASREIGNLLQQKGFCFIRGSADEASKKLAEQEAAALKDAGELTRTPIEAVDAFYGEATSCWTYSLSSPEEPAPRRETGLRAVDRFLERIGTCVVSGSQEYLKADILGRSHGLLHHSRCAEDGPAPALVDPQLAAEYVARAAGRKVVLLYYLGPNPAVLSIAQRDDVRKVFQVPIKADCVLAYSSEVCLASLETRGFALSLEVDLLIRPRASLLQAPTDLLSVPAALDDWYSARLQEIKQDSILSQSRDIPLSFVKHANLSFCQGEAIKIASIWHELPTGPPLANGLLAPFEASVLGGLDVVTSIIAPPKNPLKRNDLEYFGAKWDMSEYYDEDPQHADDFKMYSKHLSVLQRGYDTSFDFNFQEFGITVLENASLDPRCRLLCEAHAGCLQKMGLDKSEVKGKNMGIYAGLSGQQQDWNFMAGGSKINQYSWSNSSSASTVSRISYSLDLHGPCISIDTEDSSGLMAVDSAVYGLRQGRCGEAAFASSASWIANPFELVMLCAAGFMSRSGRTRVFDDAMDGFTKGEGVVTAMLTPRENIDSGKAVLDVSSPLLVGSGVNSKGQSSNLSAPNAFAMQDVLARASKDAQMPLFIADAVEANASGSRIADSIELGVLMKALQHEDQEAQTVPIRSGKASYGNLGHTSGLVSLARSCLLLDRSLHGPQVHLRQLVDLSGLGAASCGEERQRLHFLTEVIEARGYRQLVGVSSFGASGSSCHQLVIGEKPTEQRITRKQRPLTWWPGSKQKEVNPPLRGYFIVGTWTAWEQCQRMEEESEGVFAYTLTMGENNWENFQVWLDEDNEQVLHPMQTQASRESSVAGPECVGKELSWRISGSAQTVRLINEAQQEQLKDADAEEKKSVAVVFEGDYVPEGVTKGASISEMPLVQLNAGMEGKPGDKYRIRLHVRGKYKRLEWTKARGVDAIVALGQRRHTHKYHVIGDHSYWTFQQMEDHPSTKGVFSAEVQLLKETSNFQIFRDGDWDQGFYPAVGSDSSSTIHGPDGLGQGKNWQISGKVGDVFRIDFQRHVVKQKDQRSLSWQFVRPGEVDFQEMAKSHKYFLAGSWNGFQDVELMTLDTDSGHYRQEVTIGMSGTETFQILLNQNWLAAVHPDANDATQDDGHRLQGPDDGGVGRYWTIGADPADGISPGDHAMVSLEMAGGLPRRVRWEKYDSPDAHHEYLARGCQKIFERHLRLMGLIPRETLEKPARLSKKPEFYR